MLLLQNLTYYSILTVLLIRSQVLCPSLLRIPQRWRGLTTWLDSTELNGWLWPKAKGPEDTVMLSCSWPINIQNRYVRKNSRETRKEDKRRSCCVDFGWLATRMQWESFHLRDLWSVSCVLFKGLSFPPDRHTKARRKGETESPGPSEVNLQPYPEFSLSLLEERQDTDARREEMARSGMKDS